MTCHLLLHVVSSRNLLNANRNTQDNKVGMSMRKIKVAIYHHQAGSQYYLWSDVCSGDLQVLKREWSHMAPNVLNHVSLNNTKANLFWNKFPYEALCTIHNWGLQCIYTNCLLIATNYVYGERTQLGVIDLDKYNYRLSMQHWTMFMPQYKTK